MREKRLSLNAAKQGRTAGWNPGECGTGRVGGRGKHGRWGVLKGCEPVEIGGGGGGGGRYATKLNISQSTKGLN